MTFATLSTLTYYSEWFSCAPFDDNVYVYLCVCVCLCVLVSKYPSLVAFMRGC